jgi:hypothetical protein
MPQTCKKGKVLSEREKERKRSWVLENEMRK